MQSGLLFFVQDLKQKLKYFKDMFGKEQKTRKELQEELFHKEIQLEERGICSNILIKYGLCEKQAGEW